MTMTVAGDPPMVVDVEAVPAPVIGISHWTARRCG